jgi:hypothetical protein
VLWFARAFRAIGLVGCSSHFDRRTFITRAARLVHKAGGSLRDVQLLAGLKGARSVLRHIRVSSKQELKERLIAAIDYFNDDPVVHTWA